MKIPVATDTAGVKIRVSTIASCPELLSEGRMHASDLRMDQDS
jgi:hypothetical protein